MQPRLTVLLLGILLGQFSPLHSIEKNGQLEIGLDVAALRLAGGEQNDSVIRNKISLDVSYFTSSFFALSYNLNYGSVKPRDGDSWFSSDPNLDFKTFLAYHYLEVSFYPLPHAIKIQPFVAAGTGLLQWDLSDVSSGGSIFGDGLFYGRSLNGGPVFNTLLSGKIGAHVKVRENIFLTPFFRFSHIFDQKDDNIGTLDINDTILEFGLGIGYRFFVKKDSDGDGVIDRFDKAPLEPEDFDGFEDGDGKPEYDNDKDGIHDAIDNAPNLPEDMDGFEDEDGIPDYDNDWDGIPDVSDSAPNSPEDFDGFMDEDGKPDLDDDQDGVPDLTDLCKGQKETINGYRDDDGCPDTVPEPILEKGERIVLEGITFQLASATIRPQSFEILDHVYESLYANPEIEIEIRGYTDNTGSLSLNQTLSKDRANSVRDYLIEKGIDSYRIIAKGFGPVDPIATNATESGRSKNRRIEFFRER
jgi:outer membrane protein OmpA-like peptidoglycan-associated protein